MIVGLVGNQNSGKTTLFNLLTGSNAKVGNWAGVTLERKEGVLKGYEDIHIVDTPGVYSLSPYTDEEKVTRAFCLNSKPDLIINIVDATSLERSLYLTTQLAELDTDIVVALNMTDILEENGITIDEEKLSKELGITIVKISAKKNLGISNLIELISSQKYLKNPHQSIYSPLVQKEIDHLINDIETELEEPCNQRFSAVKIFERDPFYIALINQSTEKEIQQIEEATGMDSEQLIADERYKFVVTVKESCCHVEDRGETKTDKIDRILLNKWAAIPIFILIIGLVYFLSVYVVGELTRGFLNAVFNGSGSITMFGQKLNFACKGLGPLLFDWIHITMNGSYQTASLIRDGIVTGVSSVINFLPQLMVLFFCLSILETSGYMSRISFFFDRVFKRFGLSGKSLIPFIVGSGCSVPGIAASRTVEDEKEKNLTVTLTPFIPCSAKLPLISLLSAAIIKNSGLSWVIAFSLYLLAIIMIILGAIILKRFYKSSNTSFISELPSYKMPSLSYAVKEVYEKTISFIKRAGSIILLCSVVVWVLSRYTWTFKYVGEIVEGKTIIQKASMGDSMLGNIGKVLAYIFIPTLGGNYSWEASVSAIQGLIAKEQIVSSLSVLSGSENPLQSPALSFFTTNGFASYGYMVFNLFCAPCFGAISAMRKEFGSTRQTLKTIAFQTLLALLVSSLIGSIGWMINGFAIGGL